MKVGDYVRTKDGCVGKIIDINLGDFQTRYELDNSDEFHYEYKNDIIKSSPNIIDLIEVGDYVNGKKVTKTNLDRSIDKRARILCEDPHFDCLDEMYANEDIKSIVTKEQFESAKYEV